MSAEIAPESRKFLIELFTELRKDLEERSSVEGGAGPARELAIFEALLPGLEQADALPDDEEIREFVAGLAVSTDIENEYEQVSLEHRALEELRDALAART